MAKFKYALFYDFHTPALIPDTGAAFDAEAFADQIQSCGVDFLTWHARCNQGNAYYDTEIGRKHPSLSYDMIRAIGNACRKRKIRLSVYLNGELSEEELIRHPEWMNVNMEGETIHRHGNDYGPFSRIACCNSPFRDHLCGMALELAEKYPVDGFFFDCLLAFPCVCRYCVEEMKEKGIDWRDRNAVVEFSRFSVNRMCSMLNDAIRKVKPDAFLFFNGRPFEDVIGMESHLECECLPTGGWGYEYLPVCAHYMRTVAGPEKCVLNMTGRFNEWGDFGGLRSQESLEYDLFYGAANGMRPDIGGHFHPRGDMDMPVFDRIRAVYAKLQLFDEWTLDAVNDPDVALVCDFRRDAGTCHPWGNAVIAAVRMLTELKIPFDLVTDFAPWDKYRLLIIPENVPFTEEYAKRIRAHLKRGGAVIAASGAGLDPQGKRFAVDSWPAVYKGPISHDPLYFMPRGKCADGLPDMPLSVYASGSLVEAAEGAQAEMFFVKPYFNRGWDGLRTNFYAPPRKTTNEPFLLRKGNVIYIGAELFNGYFNFAPSHLKRLLDNAITVLMPDRKLKTDNLPSFSRAFVQKKGTMELVHLLSYCPEKRGASFGLEDRIPLIDAGLSLRMDGRTIRKVYLAPDRTELPHMVRDGYCSVRVPRIDGYGLVVFEWA